MDNKLAQLAELNKMLKSDLITNEEYKNLLKDVVRSKIESTKIDNLQEMQNFSVKRIKHAGSNAMGIFYWIIFQIFVVFGYWFLIGFKIGYNDASGQTEDIGSFLEYVKNLNYFFYFIEFIIALFIMLNLFYLGVNLKNVDKKPN